MSDENGRSSSTAVSAERQHSSTAASRLVWYLQRHHGMEMRALSRVDSPARPPASFIQTSSVRQREAPECRASGIDRQTCADPIAIWKCMVMGNVKYKYCVITIYIMEDICYVDDVPVFTTTFLLDILRPCPYITSRTYHDIMYMVHHVVCGAYHKHVSCDVSYDA